MPRAVDGSKRKNRRKKIMKAAKGFRGKAGTLHRQAKDAVAKAGMYAYRDRRRKKREFRRLWITRISAACRNEGINYSGFISGLSRKGITLNRKAISNMAVEDPDAFKQLVTEARSALSA